jgi:hypothetical protein
MDNTAPRIVSSGNYLTQLDRPRSMSEQDSLVITYGTKVTALPLSQFFFNKNREESQLLFKEHTLASRLLK